MNTPPSWIEVSLTVPAFLCEEVCALIFEETGQGSVSEEQKEADQAIAVIRTYLPKNEDLRERLHRIKRRVKDFCLQFRDTDPPVWNLRHLFEENWQEDWKRYFKPLRIAPGVIVCPTWETFEAGPGESLIRLDPGQAFGTGGHASTRLCLKAMETLRKEAPSPDALFSRVLDIGTGTGILALAAASFGAGSVFAIDHDPLAVEAASYHVQLNRWEHKIQVELTTAERIEGPFSLILANLTLKDLLLLAPTLRRLLLAGGRLVASGILDSQAKTLIGAFGREKILFESLILEEEWACVLFRSTPKGD